MCFLFCVVIFFAYVHISFIVPMHFHLLFSISGSIQGVEEFGEMVLEIAGSKHQNVPWKDYGFHLSVPDEAVPNDGTISLAVKAVLSGHFELPEDVHQVSTFYWVSASGEFHKEVSMHIQHCAIISSEKEASNYNFISSKCFQKDLPYTFEIVEGAFPSHSQVATTSFEQFSIFAAIFHGKRKDLRVQYFACCFVKQVSSSSWESSFVVTINVEPMIQVLNMGSNVFQG